MRSGGAPPQILALSLALSLALLLPLGGCSGIDGGDGEGDATAVARDVPHRMVPDIRPDQLLGLDADRLTAMLGPADFRRADGPAEIWQYRDETCVLDLFLYNDGASGGWRVEHVEYRDRAVSPSAATSDCPTTLLHQRRQQVG